MTNTLTLKQEVRSAALNPCSSFTRQKEAHDSPLPFLSVTKWFTWKEQIAGPCFTVLGVCVSGRRFNRPGMFGALKRNKNSLSSILKAHCTLTHAHEHSCCVKLNHTQLTENISLIQQWPTVWIFLAWCFEWEVVLISTCHSAHTNRTDRLVFKNLGSKKKGFKSSLLCSLRLLVQSKFRKLTFILNRKPYVNI